MDPLKINHSETRRMSECGKKERARERKEIEMDDDQRTSQEEEDGRDD